MAVVVADPAPTEAPPAAPAQDEGSPPQGATFLPEAPPQVDPAGAPVAATPPVEPPQSEQAPSSTADPVIPDLTARLADPSEYRSLLEEHPELRNYVENRERTAVGRAEADVKRAAASYEAVAGQLGELVRDPNLYDTRSQALTAAGQSKVQDLLQSNRNYAEQEVSTNFFEYLKGHVTLDPAKVMEANNAHDRNDADGFWSAYVGAITTGHMGSVKLADLSESAPLHAEIETRISSQVTERLAAELRAHGITQQNGAAPATMPASTAGQNAGAGVTHDLTTMLGVTRAVRAGQITEADGTSRLAEILAG